MKYIKITTPENIEIEYRLAGVMSRFVAYEIDLFIVTIFTLVINHIIQIFNISDTSLMDVFVLENALNSFAVYILILLVFAISYGYFIVSEMVLSGQTIGKKILGLRVVKNNGQPITLWNSLTRNFVRYFIDNFIGVFFIANNKKSKSIGDFAAGTIVIAEDLNFISDYLTADSLLRERSIIVAPLKLSEDEKLILREFVKRKDGFQDSGDMLYKKWRGYISETHGIPIEKVTMEFLANLV